MTTVAVCVEVGTKRTFASAKDWPGWARAGRDVDTAMQALSEYSSRYRSALLVGRSGLRSPSDADPLKIVESLKGDATTDFGAPSAKPASDARKLSEAELDRLVKILRACWVAFDRAAQTSTGVELRKGPRGGGRDVDAIVAHILEADRAYLGRLGGSSKVHDMTTVRRHIIEAVRARAHGEAPAPSRRTAPLWTPAYGVRRSAWHALDHAWEIEDRS